MEFSESTNHFLVVFYKAELQRVMALTDDQLVNEIIYFYEQSKSSNSVISGRSHRIYCGLKQVEFNRGET